MYSEQDKQRDERILSQVHEILHGPDGLIFEELYDAEIAQFESAQQGQGVRHNDISAALIARDSGRMDIVNELHAGRLHELGAHIDLDDLPSVSELQFI